jgi:hypothetical protein
METYNINYGYTTFLAFLINLRFNNSRKIDIETLKNFPKLFLRKLKNQNNQYNITMIIDIDDFNEFLEDSKDIFDRDERYIYLKDDVSLEDLYDELLEFDVPFTGSAIYILRFDGELKETLKLNGIRKIFDRHQKFEEELKKYYLSFAYGTECSDYLDRINNMLVKRNDFYHKLISRSKEFVNDCHAEASTFDKVNPFAYFYPLDKEIDFDELFPDDYNIVDEVLNDIYMFTIFISVSDPTYYRMYEDINGIDLKYTSTIKTTDAEEYRKELNKRLMKIASEKGKLCYTIRTRSQMLFYLKYIKCIEELIGKYGPNTDLELVKYKLIYLLDDNSLNLMYEENREKEYNLLYSKYLSEKDISVDDAFKMFEDNEDIILDPFEFDWFTVLIKALIVDIFEGEIYDETLKYKKLAMIKTYYSITSDEQIIKLLNQYSDHNNFWEYFSYIKGRQLNLIRKPSNKFIN